MKKIKLESGWYIDLSHPQEKLYYVNISMVDEIYRVYHLNKEIMYLFKCDFDDAYGKLIKLLLDNKLKKLNKVVLNYETV